jgi:hypothetical protein
MSDMAILHQLRIKGIDQQDARLSGPLRNSACFWLNQGVAHSQSAGRLVPIVLAALSETTCASRTKLQKLRNAE